MESSVLVKAQGSDEHRYSVRALSWNLEKVKQYYEHFSSFEIFSDDMKPGVESFFTFIMQGDSVWFEIYDETEGKPVGVMYLTDIVVSGTDAGYTSAKWHGMVDSALWHATLWDADAYHRRPVLKEAIKTLFQILRLHRLQAEVPMKHGGAIRIAKKLGFVEEGRIRQARKYKGVYFDVMVMGLLREEVEA